jgi:hypothetical protein
MAPQPLMSRIRPSGDEAAQNEEVKKQRWNWATQWSLPKDEAMGLLVPGLFGYRMDTPGGEAYWGSIGRDPALDSWFDAGRKGPKPPGFMRFAGGGNYLGVLVVLVSLWALLRSFRKSDDAFNSHERKLIWFWSGAAVVFLLLAFGRFAPFYRLLYATAFFSDLRNPIKYIEPTVLAVSVLFAYGLKGIWRQYLAQVGTASSEQSAGLKSWWGTSNRFYRGWAIGCIAVLTLSLCGWIIYAASKGALASYLATVGFDPDMAPAIAAFSVRQMGWFVIFFMLDAGLVALILSGRFAGARAKWAGFLLGLLLVIDLGRANLPWLVYWNYPQKYATNDVLRFLQQDPYEHRVTSVAFGNNHAGGPDLESLYRIQWMQHQFPFYNIQSLDIVQVPRMPKDLMAFEQTFQPVNASTMGRMARRWQLTNTRYLLGAASLLDTLNHQLDPVQKRFRIAHTFDLAPAPGISHATRLEDLTAVFSPDGPYAIFEFTGALPRARLYSHWLVNTNDPTVLAQLSDPVFDPERTVLVSSEIPTNNETTQTSGADDGKVEFVSYAPKEMVLKTESDSAAVLLLNDRYDPQWTVTVDGQPAALLRCNYLMRGAQVPAGAHTVRFKFEMPFSLPFASLDVEPDTQAVSFVFHIPTGVPSYVTLAAYGVGVVLVGMLVVGRRRGV